MRKLLKIHFQKLVTETRQDKRTDKMQLNCSWIHSEKKPFTDPNECLLEIRIIARWKSLRVPKKVNKTCTLFANGVHWIHVFVLIDSLGNIWFFRYTPVNTLPNNVGYFQVS